jgi:hypothetical protein
MGAPQRHAVVTAAAGIWTLEQRVQAIRLMAPTWRMGNFASACSATSRFAAGFLG